LLCRRRTNLLFVFRISGRGTTLESPDRGALCEVPLITHNTSAEPNFSFLSRLFFFREDNQFSSSQGMVQLKFLDGKHEKRAVFRATIEPV
jgi:hypothetical protein